MGGLGVIIESNLNRVRLSCCGVGVGLGCDNFQFKRTNKCQVDALKNKNQKLLEYKLITEDRNIKTRMKKVNKKLTVIEETEGS